jgi:hypothetical protein
VSSRGGARGPVVLGLVMILVAGAGSYGWLAASAPSRAASASTAPGPEGAQEETPSVAPPAPSGAATSEVAYTQQALDSLAALVPAPFVPTCAPEAPSASALFPTRGATAALRCQQGGKALLYETLPDLTATEAAFDTVVAASGLTPDPGGCWDGSPGIVPYSHGRVACWTTPGGTRSIAWTYEPANVIAVVATSGGLRPLVSWWWFKALVQPPVNAAGLNPDEQALVDLLPADVQATCRHYDPAEDAGGFDPIGSLGSVDCFPKSPPVADVGVFAFTSADALATWYDYRVAQAKEEPDSGGCLDGTPGETAWEHGRILCLVTSGRKAAIRWTDDRYQLYGALNATGKDLPALVEWWRSQGLP